MRQNELLVKVFLPPLLRVVDAPPLLVSFVLTSSAPEWLIITCSKVWAPCVFVCMHMCVCMHVCCRYSRKFYANMHVLFFFISFHFPSLIPFESMSKTLKKKNKKQKMNKSNTAYFVAVFNAWKKKREKEKRERHSNHSNEGLSLLGPGVVCPGSLFLAPC